MRNKNISIIDYYQKELKRIAWRLQYRAKVKRNRETGLNDYLYSTIPAHDYSTESHLYVKELIDTIPFHTGRQVIFKIYVQDKSETQVAKEMNISQQAVSKWKKKCLKYLYQKMSS
ncbi:sigma-70 family RNA polymerase sigma factor [Paenibacillus alvei]|uniref:Sigma-70 family RNA polymerase sigma factor n=1 Tax=Paenibacillus alvei TaxID=44250 RepID=A0ABT4H1D3_PAEAL|nr:MULTISPECIES: sigma-70 family RNA polymerase sigma factor [Paenibacillus]EJW13759.1 hypothetical protein PAV_16p00070 [Paenibacillus alvei DSM 29]MCY9540765.1 sigma-70 family RNA polymerase sigma factor [Paenibacillus alvei]MCY9702616.1 sigma-70 family RNA polymerase sigma factor [Paenibacillus alvei]MCY9732149.1 sigma-70 family RNA polymerase sigma factor [Paenibacillus alvei]MCY9752771.1 sigma-70 family RNA polymerase sigma factor [Paenibacillus alvei]